MANFTKVEKIAIQWIALSGLRTTIVNRTDPLSICFGVDAIFKCANLKPLKLFKVWLIDVLFGNKFADSVEYHKKSSREIRVHMIWK